jgi:hypothetical protein
MSLAGHRLTKQFLRFGQNNNLATIHKRSRIDWPSPFHSTSINNRIRQHKGQIDTKLGSTKMANEPQSAMISVDDDLKTTKRTEPSPEELAEVSFDREVWTGAIRMGGY